MVTTTFGRGNDNNFKDDDPQRGGRGAGPCWASNAMDGRSYSHRGFRQPLPQVRATAARRRWRGKTSLVNGPQC